MSKEEILKKITEKVLGTDEEDFLKYLIDCCDNVLEKPHIISDVKFHPVVLQLTKMRAEVTSRLKIKYGVLHGKFSYGNHLFNKGRK